MASTLNDGLHCTICSQHFREPVMIPQCGHSFCKPCLDRLPKQMVGKTRSGAGGGGGAAEWEATCPTCNNEGKWAAFSPDSVIPNHPLKRMVEAQVGSHPENRKSFAVEGRDSPLPSAPPLDVNQWDAPSKPNQSSETGAGAGASGSTGSRAIIQHPSRNPETSALRLEFLESEGVPQGLAQLVEEQDAWVGMRIYILDNSGSTCAHDGQYIPKEKLPGGRPVYMRPRDCTRWEEIKRMALEQAEWNAAVLTPCSFFLLNPHSYSGPLAEPMSNAQEGVDFVTINPSLPDVHLQVESLRRMLENSYPTGTTPLGDCIAMVSGRIMSNHQALRQTNQRMFLIIVTDGLPTLQTTTVTCQRARNHMVTELRKLTSTLPVFVVIRLCTSEDDVVEFWNSLDEEVEFPLDVLDDIESEAQEIVKVGNNWCTYCPVLQTIREGGTNVKLLDLLDERAFTGGELAAFASLVLLRNDAFPLPDWRDVDAFVKALRTLLHHAPEVYNPITQKMSPILNLTLIEKLLRKDKGRRGRPGANNYAAATAPCSCTIA